MKSKNVLIFGLAAIGLLASCSGSGTSSFSSSATSTEESSESSQATSKKKSAWAGEVGETIIDSFGWDMPYIESDDASVKAGVDAFGDNYLWLYLSYDGADDDESLISNKMAEYANICVTKGFTVTYETVTTMDEDYMIYEFPVYYCDRQMSDTVGFEMQVVEGAIDGQELMGIYAFTYPIYDENSWPSIMVEKVLGYDVPHLEDGDYTYEAMLSTFDDDGEPYCYIYATGCYEEDIEEYNELLASSGYQIYNHEDEYGYTYYAACDVDKTHSIVYGYDYEEYIGSFFMIYEYPTFTPPVINV